jgi:hypothetical protein
VRAHPVPREHHGDRHEGEAVYGLAVEHGESAFASNHEKNPQDCRWTIEFRVSSIDNHQSSIVNNH